MEIYTHPAEQSKPLFVLRRTSTGSRVLPVQIQTVKSMSPQKSDSRLDELLTISCSRNCDGEPAKKQKNTKTKLTFDLYSKICLVLYVFNRRIVINVCCV